MSIIIPGSGDSAELLVGNRVKLPNKNLITAETNYLSPFQDASQSPGTLSTVAAGGNIATTAGLFYSTSTGTAFTLTSNSSTALRGTNNFLSATNTAANVDGSVFFQFPATALEASDLGKPVSISFDITGQTFVGWDVVVVRYNSSGTFQNLISVAGTASSSTSTPSAQLPTGTTQFRGFFVASSTAGDLYALRFRRLSATPSAEQIRLDTLYVGPQVQLAGAPVTDWQSYTPTVSNLGAGSSAVNLGWWRRVGDSMEIHISFTKDATPGSGAGTVLFSIPSGYSIDTAKTRISSNGQVSGYGFSYAVEAAAQYFPIAPFVSSGTPTEIEIVNQGSATTYQGADFRASAEISLSMILPIVGWSSNVTMAERAVEEYASNSGTWDANDTTSFVNGPSGSAIGGSLTDDRVKRVRFQTPIQATDAIILEVSNDGNRWQPVGSAALDGVPVVFSLSGTGTFATSAGCFARDAGTAATDLEVLFCRYQLIANDDSPVTNWTTGRWRVRKVSGGAAVGFPVGARNVVGDVTGTAVPAGYIGETLESVVGLTTLPGTTGQYGDATSLTITPGKWRLDGLVYFNANGAAVTYCRALITTTSGNSSTGEVLGSNSMEAVGPTAANDQGVCVPGVVVNITSATTYYLKTRASYTVATPRYYARLTATRIA